ncbi:hypothetical protein EYC84_004712 [Monilinia fructicola]|uniref:Het-C-domain-containing protein n=1 Tax=Monilinia fructicola TaxID=38448 RepID=A0A5M9K4H2_MONFR|nr:hypothetical protein EYC84_004712 [Monilinia fructicola]
MDHLDLADNECRIRNPTITKRYSSWHTDLLHKSTIDPFEHLITNMPSLSSSTLLLAFAILLLLAHPVHAFGAGNIASVSKIEGINWRHGDIEDTLLSLVMSRACGGKKFDKMMVARVYFGNWLRDYSQAIDVGTVKYVSAEAIRILLWVLGFMTFGYGTREFEVTAQRLGCYRPEDHIDNPKDYADNLDASQYDRRLRGPVDEESCSANPFDWVDLMDEAEIRMNYTRPFACWVRDFIAWRIILLTVITPSWRSSRWVNGMSFHTLEDTRRLISPARATRFYPIIITGTFGGVDFLHSVMGEFDDKATQSEIQTLEGTMQEGSQSNSSILKDLLNSVPSGLFGGKDQAGKADELQANAAAAQESQEHVSPKDPEAFTQQMQQVAKEIYPIIQWHDEIMQQIREAIEKIPILPDLIENIEEQINIFVFSLLAPFVLPIIGQIKTELNTGSSEVIQSSKTISPISSMKSLVGLPRKFLKWVVPQLISCWDDERIDPDRTIDRIIHGVFHHHPALRNYGDDGASDGRQIMFRVVEEWWHQKDQAEQDEFRGKLSREGVENGENHLEGVHDTGHGCGAPLKMSKQNPGASSNPLANELMGGFTAAMGGNGGSSGFSDHASSGIGKFAGEAVGGGALGAGVLGKKGKEEAYSSEGYNSQGNYQQSYTEIGHAGNRYAQAEYTQEQLPDGGRRTEYQQYGQSGGHGVGFEEISEQRPSYGGGYEETNERIYERADGRIETETWREGETADGRHYHEARHHREERSVSGSESDDSGRRRRHRRHHSRRGSGSSSRDSDRPQEYIPEREERRERFEEPPRQRRIWWEYGGGYGGGYGVREKDMRKLQGSKVVMVGTEVENLVKWWGGWRRDLGVSVLGGGSQRERDEEPEDEYRDERREERGWGFLGSGVLL